jgi:hypothetical protein
MASSVGDSHENCDVFNSADLLRAYNVFPKITV